MISKVFYPLYLDIWIIFIYFIRKLKYKDIWKQIQFLLLLCKYLSLWFFILKYRYINAFFSYNETIDIYYTVMLLGGKIDHPEIEINSDLMMEDHERVSSTNIKRYTVFDAVQPPLLSSPPVNLEESWSLKFFNKKFYCKRLCLWTYYELDLLFFFVFPIYIRCRNNKTTLQLYF